MPRWARDLVSLVADLIAIGGAIGWITGISLTAAIGAVGYFTNVPWFYILVFSPIGAAGALWLIDQLVRPRSAEQLVAHWKDQDSYFVWVAACLWIGVPPSPRIDERHKAYPMLQRIKGALVAGQIKSLWGDSGMNARVPRQELLKLADALKDRPRFLFPEG